MELLKHAHRRPSPAVALVLVGLTSACSGSEAGRALRSALIVTLDTTRADALTCLGGREGVSPRLDALAREGVLYTNARTTAPITLPAHASMFTGLYPIRHSARDNGRTPLPASAVTLAELAAAAGLDTAAFVAAAVLDDAYGLDQGFATYVDPTRPHDSSILGLYVERPAEDVVTDAVRWLRSRRPDRPFLLWVHLFDPHAPYLPPPSFLRQAGGNPYLGEVARADAAVGQLLDALAELERERDTLVLVVGDHGEGLGQHGEATHGSLAYDSTLRVPLIVRNPSGRRGGSRCDDLVSVVDVLPTVAAALDLSLPAGVDGVDLLHVPADPARGLYFETCYGFLHYGWSPIAGWIEGGIKYLHDAAPQLFDVVADAGERRDLAGLRAADIQRARAGIAAVAALPRLEPEETADPALLPGLRALGYAAAVADEEQIPHPLAPTTFPPARARLEELMELARAAEAAKQGRPGEAAELLAGLLLENPANRTAAENRATYLIADGRCEEAVPLFEGMIASGARSAETHLNLGYCLQLAGRDEEAVAHFLRAHELDAGNTSALRNLVVVLSRLGREEEAQRFRRLLDAAVPPPEGPR